MDIKIRLAEEADYESVENIMKQVHKLHVDWRPDVYKTCETVLPFEVFQNAVCEKKFLVAVADNKVVGLLFYIIRHIEASNQVTGDVLFIDSMAVEETYRGQGIGHKLFDFVKNIVKEKKYDGLELQVNAKNIRAKQMYEKYGFLEKSINMELR